MAAYKEVPRCDGWFYSEANYGPWKLEFWHDDYDGPGDDRHGFANTVEEIERYVAEIEDEIAFENQIGEADFLHDRMKEGGL